MRICLVDFTACSVWQSWIIALSTKSVIYMAEAFFTCQLVIMFTACFNMLFSS